MVLHELRKLQLKGVFIEGVGDMVEGCVSDPKRLSGLCHIDLQS